MSRSAAPAPRLSSRVRACTSSNSRTFSIAITAWSAKVVTQLDLLLAEWLDRRCVSEQNDRLEFPSRSSGTPSAVRIFATFPRAE